MRQIREYLTTKIIKQNKIVANNESIVNIIRSELDRLGRDADLNHIDVSKVTDMYGLFVCIPYDSTSSIPKNCTRGLAISCKDANPDISEWNVGNVERMDCMFYDNKKFNCDLSRWDVSNVINMHSMFRGCKSFKASLNDWNVSKVRDMEWMFSECESFNQPLNNWNVSSVERMDYMFYGCKSFNQSLSKWHVSNVRSMEAMFHDCESFNQNLSMWDVSNITPENHRVMFTSCPIKEEFKPHFK